MTVTPSRGTLKQGVKREDYEKWLVEYDYRVARSLPSIASYRTHRIEGPINGAETAGWSYIERIEIRDVEQYQRDRSWFASSTTTTSIGRRTSFSGPKRSRTEGRHTWAHGSAGGTFS